MQSQELVPAWASPLAALPAPPQHAPGLSLSQLLAILRAWWRKGLIITASTVVLAGLATLVMPKTYTSTATLMVNWEINDPLGGREFPAGLLGNYVATQVELLGSPAVLREVVNRLKLTQRKDYAGGFKGDPAQLRDFIARQMAKKLVVTQGQYGSQLINVTYSARNAADAAAITNAVVDVYREQLHQRQAGPAEEHAQRYGEELKALKEKVDHAQQVVTKFRQDNQLVEIQVKADIESSTLNELEHRLLEAQNARRAAESRLASDQSVSPTVLNSQLVQTLKTRLAQLESQRAELRNTLGMRHPQMQEIQSQIATTKKTLDDEIGKYASGANGELVSAKELEGKLTKAVQEQRSKTLQVRSLQDEGAKYVLELESAQSSYKKALDGYDQVLIEATGRYTAISVVNRATPPLRPSKPNLMMNLALGLLLGLGLGVAGPLAYELMTRRVRCRDDLERDYGIPVLAEFEPVPALRALA
ncbi:MAG TPA: Wzz/FepE/Etk N-terminal domain-containing protein [Candidatus Binatia bacterium]|nr:Wzz/FepE/Etk N-terminal domain-containing protein [Candidatus Binatia bacterium]